ncbi:MAG: glycosyl transferase family 39 [Acidobacteria bacterium]|nr:glycosyl transferase family 39 [Acidobacteriota bacterium]
MPDRQRKWIAYLLLLVTAFSFRFCVARFLANDTPGDGRVYAQMARNLLEHHVYSHDTEPPFAPSLIRLPGYPLFLAAIYSVFGHYNNTAVRIVQALLDTLTCGLVALLAFLWEPDRGRKRRASLAALALAAACPFTTIYVGTILTETWASLLAITLCLLATLAIRSSSFKQALWRWAAVGLIGSLSVFFRPDSGLFIAAVGLTLVITEWFRRNSDGQATGWRFKLARVFAAGSVLSITFVLLLVPWTVRNWRTFHLFQPLSPAHGEMPGEFVPRGYYAWVRSWVDDGRYVETVLWTLDDKPIDPDDLPEYAFDSAEEKARVAALLDQYNDPPSTDEPATTEEPSPSPTPAAESAGKNPSPGKQQPSPSPPLVDENAADEKTGDEEQPEEAAEPVTPEMTPAIDAAFGQIARERIARAPVRYYLWLPLKRAWSLWANPHADYYPFSGELFPLDDLDYSIHQHIWLPLFAVLVGIYSLLGIAGGWVLWRARDFAIRRWLLLAALMMFIRLAFFSTMENPEPRYVVELFPFLAVLGGIAIARIRNVRQT